jgi:hypothetical protein
MNMQDNEPMAAQSDPPIIIQGGGSVDIDVPTSFTQVPPASYVEGSGKNFKNTKVNLVSLQINEDTPITLNKNDKIKITYK